jgi:fructosamine-3-kinase
MSKTPPIYDWMKPEDMTFRQSAEVNFLEALAILGYGTPKTYEAMQHGHSSVVYKFETEQGSFICKLSNKDIFDPDVLFYDICEQYKIKVPHIYKSLQVKEDLFICLMEFIPAATLAEIPKNEVLTKGKYGQIGKTLAELHKIKGSGFGTLQDGQGLVGKFTNFMDMINERFINDNIISVVSSYLTNDQIDVAKKASEFLNQSFIDGERGSLCHGDMSTSNSFDTDPITIFDPGPAAIMHPLLDLALVMVYECREEEIYPSIYEQLVNGYQSVSEIDQKSLSAAIIIMAFRKLATAIRKSNAKRVVAYLKLFQQHSEIFAK